MGGLQLPITHKLHIKTLALLPLSYVSSFRYSTALTALSLRIHCIFYKHHVKTLLMWPRRYVE